MKKYSFSFFIFLGLTVITIKLYSQKSPEPKYYNTHGKKYFYQLSLNRFKNILNNASEQLQNEMLIAKRLTAKNDSLLTNGIIYDSVSTDVKQYLFLKQSSIDSLSSVVNIFQQKIKSNTFSRKQFLEIAPQITGLGNYLSKSKPVTLLVYKGIELQLDTSIISDEKFKLKGILNSASIQQAKEAVILQKIDNKNDSILKIGNIDLLVSDKIDARLKFYKQKMDSIAIEITDLKQKINTPKEITKNFTLIKTKIVLIDSIINKGAVSREYIFNMIDEGLSVSKPNLFSLAAFFGSGGFNIPLSKFAIAKKYFSPVIDSLVKFSNKYASVLRTATIKVNGFADGSKIGEGTILYNKLVSFLNKDNPDKQELNIALSSLRAQEISNFLTSLLKERFPSFQLINKIVFEVIESGEGEKYPNPTIKDYKINDDRRRIVIIFWNVIPAE